MPLRLGFIAVLIGIYFAGAQLAAHHAPTWTIAALMGLVFVALVIAMYLRVLPAMLALPILAVALASIAGMGWRDILTKVVEDGGMRLKTAILAAILGAVLAQVVEKTGIAQTAIKKTAELSGDRPIVLAAVLTLVIAVLFMTLGGLGAVIMVATIVIPIMLSLGLRPLFVGCLFLLAMSLGGAFNLANWELYKTTLGLTNEEIGTFAWPFAGFMLVATAAFLAIESRRMGKARYKAVVTEPETRHAFVPWYALLTPLVPLIPVLAFALPPKLYAKPAVVQAVSLPPGAQVQISAYADDAAIISPPLAVLEEGHDVTRLPEGKYALTLALPANLPAFDAHETFDLSMSGVPVRLTPLTPEITVVEVRPWSVTTLQVQEEQGGAAPGLQVSGPLATTYDFPIPVALLLGILYGAIATWKRGQSTVQLLTKSAIDGVAAVGPALVLMLGIGMVLVATMSPEVSRVIQPVLRSVVPQGHSLLAVAGYVVFFTLLAPLALYRGPLNIWGMGSGLIGALSGLMPTGAIMSAFMSVGMIQGVCDPTNTHNVWIANYTGADVQDILKRTLPYMWLLAIVGLVLGAVLFYHAK